MMIIVLLTLINSSPAQSRLNTFSASTSEKTLPTSDQNLNANAFNQGYYEKFFVEENKLGKGFRGSVFLCEVSNQTMVNSG